MERNNPMLLLQHEHCYLSLLMAKYLCQRKFTADHLVLTINTVTVIYSMERPSRSTMGPLHSSKALIWAFSQEALHLCCHVKADKDQTLTVMRRVGSIPRSWGGSAPSWAGLVSQGLPQGWVVTALMGQSSGAGSEWVPRCSVPSTEDLLTAQGSLPHTPLPNWPAQAALASVLFILRLTLP